MPLLQLFFKAVPIVALTSYCILMLFFTISQKDRMIRVFMLVVAALIVSTASAVFMSYQLYPGVLFWDKVMIAGMIAVPYLLYCFVSVLTHSVSRIGIFIWGALAVLAITVDMMGYVVNKAGAILDVVTVNGYQFTAVSYDYTLGSLAYPMYFFIFSTMLAVMLKVRKSLKKGNSKFGQMSLIILGMSIMFIGSLFNAVPAVGKYPVDILAYFINAILVTVAIYKYRMLELRFMMTKGLVYSLFAMLLTVVYVYTVFFVEKNLGAFYQEAIPYFQTLSALMVAIIFQPLYRIIDKLVNRIFLKAEYSQRQALRNFSVGISNKLDLRSIARELIESVQMALHVKQMLVFMKNEEERCYDVFQTSSQLYRPDVQIPVDDPIVKWLIRNKTGLTRDAMDSMPFFKSMWEKEKRDLRDLDIELIIPMKSGNDLIGMLMLTGKQNNTAYTLDDQDLLNYLGASSAVAFENARLYTRSQKEAITDNLTKLYNHRYFFKSLAEQIEKMGAAELSLIMIDLDLFKLYNDLYGHVEGDRALEMVASIMTGVVGQKGVVCRFGGEEFSILLPYHDSRMAYEVAEKIRMEIQANFFNMSNATQRFLTASIGVCTYPHAAPNAEELLKRADLAMYTAKNQGKNQTVVYTPRAGISEGVHVEGNENRVTPPNYTATIYALTAAIDAKDHYTFGHSQRVAVYATALAANMALDDAHIEILREAALLHDVGKIGIPEDIITKTGRLTAEEFSIVQKHSEMSITIIQHLPSLNHVIPAVIAHHERWDGKGYPRGLKGENIPITARILAIADAFDAMTSNRPYRASLSVGAALNEISNNMGTQFDPAAAAMFVKLVRNDTIKVDKKIDIKHIS